MAEQRPGAGEGRDWAPADERRDADWFRDIANSAPAMLWASDETGAYIYVNDRRVQFTGRTLEAQLGGGWVDDVHPDDAERAESTFKTHFAARTSFEMEYRLRRSHADYRWVLDSGTPRFGGDVFCGYVGACVDVTDRHAAQRELASSQQLYYALAETMPALVLTTGADGEVQYCNRQLLDYCGTDIDGLRGARWVEYIHPQDVQEGRDEWLEQVETLRPFTSEYRIRRADGAYRWYLTHTAPLRNEHGEIQAWVGVSIDVHDRREAEEQTLQAAAELAHANAAKDEFLGLVSHELRTPITTIYGNAQVLRRLGAQLDAETLIGAVEDVEKEAVRLQQLVDNMFVLARVESGEVSAAEPLSLPRVVAKVVAEYQSRNGHRNIELRNDAGVGPAHGEQVWVEQTLRNLLNNADKYSPPDTPIVIAVDRSDAYASVRVLDRGHGISDDEAEHIFDAFYRSPRWADRAPGAGIGLTVSKRLVEAQGGQIWAAPREGGGTEVGFTLPLEAEA